MPAVLGWGGLVLGAALFVVAEGRWPSAPPLDEQAGIHSDSSETISETASPFVVRHSSFVVFTLLAVLAVAVTIPGFVALSHAKGKGADALAANIPSVLWLVGMALFLLGGFVRSFVGERSRGGQSSSEGLRPAIPPAIAVLVLIGIVLLAAVVRFYQLDLIPRGFWLDEAIAGEQAKQILADPTFRPIYFGGGDGEPAFYLYGLAAMIKLLGLTVLAVRFLMALAGVAGVAGLYWFARPIFGTRVALVSATILATMTWNINFSRIAFNAIWSVPIDLFAAGCLFRGIYTGRRIWYVAAGLLFGLGFHLYYISRAWLALIVLVVLFRLATERGLWKRVRGGLGVALVGLLLAAAPVLTFAVAEPEDYAARAASVSLFSAIDAAHSLEPLAISLGRHAAMFNQQGDVNGRHNLPNARMLDLVTAALLPVGFGLAAYWALRRRLFDAPRWPYVMLASSPLVLMSGGLLSNPDDAPQALRTLGVTIAVALVAALPIARFWILDLGFWSEQGKPKSAALALVAFALVGAIAVGNYNRYFRVQEPHPQVWPKFSTAATLIAGEVNRHRDDADIYTVNGLYAQPTIQFLAGGPGGGLFDAPYQTPLPKPAVKGRGAIVFIDNRNGHALPLFKAVYPHMTTNSPTAPTGGDAVLYILYIPYADLVAPRPVEAGLKGSYWSGPKTANLPAAITRIDPTPSWFFFNDPISKGNKPFTVVWEGALLAAQSGDYVFATQTIGKTEIWLDGKRVLSAEAGVPQQNDLLGNIRVPLTVGPHAVRLVVQAPGWREPVFWYWTPPGGRSEIIPFDAFRPK